MALCFQTIRSSSKGNCLALYNKHTSLIVDFGLGSMKNARKVLENHFPHSGPDAVLLTHTHILTIALIIRSA